MEELYSDLVLINGKIYTLNDSNEIAESVAIKNDKIIYVGSNEGVKKFIGPNTKVLNLNGKPVFPGFIDTHIHFVKVGFSLLTLDLREAHSIEELKLLVKGAAERSSKGKWILGRGWDQEKFPEKRYPSRKDLDEVAPENPVILSRVCGHVAVVNSKALEIAGINRSTPDPEGGRIDRDASGEPTGILREAAMALVWSKVPKPSNEDYIKAIELACEEALKHGITSVHLVSAVPEEIKALQVARALGKLKVRVCLYVSAEYLPEIFKLGIMRGFGDSFIRINGIKVLVDGSLGARTASLREPYNDDPKNTGVLTISREQLKKVATEAHLGGLQLAIHAIGDNAVEVALDVLSEVLSMHPKSNHRHRLEHVSVISKELIERMARLGVVASVQPRFIISDFWAVDRVGPRRARWVYPFKTMIEHGVYTSGGSDCPVDPLDPLYQIYSAVSRGKFDGIELYKYTEMECLSPIEAIKLFTRYASYVGFEENLKGTIEVGKLADMIVLSEDPLNIEANKIKDAYVLITIVGGEIVYRHPKMQL